MSHIRFCPVSCDYEISWEFMGITFNDTFHQSVPTHLLRELADRIDAAARPPATPKPKKKRSR